MLAEERWQSILDILQRKNIASVIELSKRLKTSEVTIRRDLKELEEAGRLKRTRGGAVCIGQNNGTYFEPQFSQMEGTNIELKEQICHKACEMISDNTAIIIDSSSTAKQLCNSIRVNQPIGLMVVTNSVRVVMDFANSDVETVLIGGQVRKNLISCIGPLADLTLSQLKVDKAFIGINGIDFLDNVITTPNLSEGAIKQGMMRCARETIVLADHTKFNKAYLSRVCKATDIDMFITDDQVDPSTIEEAAECGAELVIARP